MYTPPNVGGRARIITQLQLLALDLKLAPMEPHVPETSH